ncbi:MAG TPA: response regulator [Terriglobales bacterium]|nr:response regulator [Terriglobales bacterium]
MAEKKILLVDDDKDVLYALNVRLRSKGYQVAVAGDAISAVIAARKEKPDLIVLDIGLPGGDGFLVMQRLKLLYELALTPIIVVSAREANAARAQALGAGAAAYFQKPVNTKEFMLAVEKSLGHVPAGQPT